MKRGILSDLIIAYLLEEQNTLCTPPAGGKSQSSGNSSSANSASVSSFSFSMTCFVDKPQPGAGVVEHGDNAQSSRCRHGYIASMGWILFMQKKGLWQQLIHAAAGCEKLFFTLGGLVLMMSLHIFSIHANHLRLFPQWVVLHFMPCKRQNQI